MTESTDKASEATVIDEMGAALACYPFEAYSLAYAMVDNRPAFCLAPRPGKQTYRYLRPFREEEYPGVGSEKEEVRRGDPKDGPIDDDLAAELDWFIDTRLLQPPPAPPETLNDLACAYAWRYGPAAQAKARQLLEQALTGDVTDFEKARIRANLDIIGGGRIQLRLSAKRPDLERLAVALDNWRREYSRAIAEDKSEDEAARRASDRIGLNVGKDLEGWLKTCRALSFVEREELRR